MAQNKIFLFHRIIDWWFSKNIWEHINRINNLTSSSVNIIKEITLFVNFYNLVPLSHLFFLKINFKIFNHFSGKISKFRYKSYEKFNFFFTFRNLCIWYDIFIKFNIKLKYLTFFRCNSSEVRSWIVIGCLSKSKIFILINRFRILKIFLTISFHKQFNLSFN